MYAQINGVEQNPLFLEVENPLGWFGSVSAADNITIGGTITSAGTVRPFRGQIHEVLVSSNGVTA
jgi:hypothetical protein